MDSRILKMELHKVKQEILRHGEQYNFLRNKTNQYGEPTDEEPETVATICGLFHVSKGYATKNVQDGTRTHSKGQPMLLCCYDDVESIQSEDYFVLNGNTYKVVEKNNIQEYNIVANISLEVVINGSF